MNPEQNITLIGMPGAGKSTVGVLLAKAAQLGFTDTDLLLQARAGKPLQRILDEEGVGAFLVQEEACLLDLNVRGHVIATGGSAVYSDRAMRRLKAGGPVVWLELPIEALEGRITNLHRRGVVLPHGWNLRRLWAERTPLYRRWADHAVACEGKTQEEIVAEILARIGREESPR